MLAVAVVLVQVLVDPAGAVLAADSPLGDAAGAWPAAWSVYAFANGTPIEDVDGDVGCGTGYCDVASGGGTRPSVYIASDGTNVFFRIRVAGDPANPAAGGFLSTAYVVQIGVGGVTKAAVGLNGKSSSDDYVYVTDSGGAVVDEIYSFPFDNSAGQLSSAARSLPDGFGQYFVDYQVPIARITARSDGGAITATTPVQFFVGTSQAANLSVINKDFMTGTAVVYGGLGTMTLGATTFSASKSKAVVSGPNPPEIGTTTTYDLTVTASDEGFNAISGAVGTDTLPAGVTIVSMTTATGTISRSGQVVTWTIGTMQPGVAYTATIRVSVTPVNGDFGTTLNLNPGMSFAGTDANTGAAVSGTSNGVTAGPVAGNQVPSANDDAAIATNGAAVVIDVLANDSDPDGSLVPGTETITVAATKGSTSINLTNGRVTYTPNAGVTGTDTFTYRVCDNGSPSHCDSAIVTVTFRNSPLATDDTATATENTPTAMTVLANDNDPDGNLDPTTVSVTSGPTHGGTSVNPVTGVVTYTPTAGYIGPDSFTYQVCDTTALCDTAAVSVTVLAPNNPPVATDDTASTPEDTAVVIPVVSNDTDADGNLDPTTVTITGGATHGGVTVNALTGALNYTPTTNYNGPDSVTYQICDTSAACDTAVVSITVSPVNDPPVATDDTASTPEDTAVVTAVVANDTDVDGNLDPTTVTITAGPTHGGVTVNAATGALTYTPAGNYNGPDSITYQICDTAGLCDTAVLSITVNAVNDPPVANDDNASTPEDTAVAVAIVSNDTDVDGNLDPTTVTITAGPTHGGVTVNAVTGALTYTPMANYNGPDSVTYQICDTSAACDTATVTLTVTAVDDAPIAADDSASTPEDTAVVVDVVANDSDPDGNLDPTTVTITAGPTHGGVTVNPVTGAFTYTPAANYFGPDSVTYLVCDTTALCDTAIVSLTVNAVADAPVATDDSAGTPEDTAAVIAILANDTDADGNLDPTTVTITAAPTHGGVTVNATTGAVTYTPAANYVGPDSFTYQVCDTTALCDTASVSITVTSVDDAPVAAGDSTATAEDTAVLVDVLANDTDADGNLDPTTVVITVSPAHGTAVVDPASGAITYTPAANYNGPDSLSYQVCDTTLLCDTATILIIVSAVNDLPIVLGDIVIAADGVPVDVDVLANDSDVDGSIDPTTVSVVSGPSHGTVTVDPITGTITYLAGIGFSGGDSFTYRVCDDQGGCGIAMVAISVNGAPLAVDDSIGVLAGVATTVDVLANDDDPGGALDPASLSVVSSPVHGTISVDPVGGTLRYTSDPGYFGADSVTYRICDDGTPALCATAVLSLLVNAPPQATDDSARTLRGEAVTIDVLVNDTDPDGVLDPTSVSIVSAAAHGTLAVNPVSGRVSYTPAAGWYGDDVFGYRLCDTGSPSGCATAFVAVQVNAPPTAADDTAGTTSGQPVTIDVLANDHDPDGSVDAASVVILAGPKDGTVTIDPATGRITYTPDAGFHGTDTFTYRVCDLDVPVGCDTAIVRVGLPPTDTLAAAVGRAAGPGIAAAALLAGLVALAGLLAAPRRRREHARR